MAFSNIIKCGSFDVYQYLGKCIQSFLAEFENSSSFADFIICNLVLSLRFEVALMHIPYTVEFINRKLTNRIDLKQVTYVILYLW